LHRKGNFILPVTVQIVFDDGTRLRETWDGIDRWKKFTYTRKAKIISAEIDPDHLIPLDRDLFNNSITKQADAIPRWKLTDLLLAAQQLASQLAAWLV
ncbi:MAG: M1 family peptidase, partial [Granulicella sp.]